MTTVYRDHLRFVGGRSNKVTNITAAYTALTSDTLIVADTTAGAMPITLPPLSAAYDAATGAGMVLEVYLDVDNGDLTVVEDSGDGGATVATLNDATDSVRIQAVSATAWKVLGIVDESVISLSVPLTIAMPFTLGNRSGVNSDGVMVGALTHTAVGDCNSEDNSGASFVDETTDMNDAGAGDVALTQPFDTNDALYIGYAGTFCGVVLNVGTAGAGDAVEAETVWEYSQGGDTWATLESGHELTDDSAGLTAGTSTYVVSFVPPSDWADQAVDGGTAMRHIRFRATADDVYDTTDPLLTQGWVIPLDVGQGIVCPYSGTISAVDLQAITASATNDDTEILLVNVTQGTFAQLTWSAADVMDRVTGLSLSVTAGDGLVIVVTQEDGTTEFANGQAVVQIDI